MFECHDLDVDDSDDDYDEPKKKKDEGISLKELLKAGGS